MTGHCSFSTRAAIHRRGTVAIVLSLAMVLWPGVAAPAGAASRAVTAPDTEPPRITSHAPLPIDADPSNVLAEYLAIPQPSFGWRVRDTQRLPGGVVNHRLLLTSQTWRGGDWVHPLNVLVPTIEGEPPVTGHAILLITAGDEQAHANIVGMLAARLRVPIAILHQVPNQPLLRELTPNGRGLREDALIAETFKLFLETGEPDWPLLLPMTRSAVAAMDALELFSEDRMQQDDDWTFGRLTRFVTTGASKRGWTTWLSAAADERVIGIAPMVYDNLNLQAQIQLHLESWGAPSPSIHDYTERDLLDKFDTLRGQQLLAIVDPAAYVERLTVPKLLLMGTNDSYWPLGAVHEYLGSLPGRTFVHYVPNGGHTLGGSLTVLSAIGAFFEMVTGPREVIWPVATITRRGALAEIHLEDPASLINAVRLWWATADDLDFRRARWSRLSVPLGVEGIARATLPDAVNGAGAVALIAEIEMLDERGQPVLIHSPVLIDRSATRD